MPENGIYRELSAEMRDGLKNIYQQLSTASAAGSAATPDALFTEASSQLKEVVKATETVAMDIMDIIEKQLETIQNSRSIIEHLETAHGTDRMLDELKNQNKELEAGLTSVLTLLSFQDITGQRIKKVMAALNVLEQSVVELYLSSGLVMEAAEQNPEADASSIKAQAEKAMEDYRENRAVKSELKGPDSSGITQVAIDDMLAQLGL